jgi:hypothetical protein
LPPLGWDRINSVRRCRVQKFQEITADQTIAGRVTASKPYRSASSAGRARRRSCRPRQRVVKFQQPLGDEFRCSIVRFSHVSSHSPRIGMTGGLACHGTQHCRLAGGEPEPVNATGKARPHPPGFFFATSAAAGLAYLCQQVVVPRSPNRSAMSRQRSRSWRTFHGRPRSRVQAYLMHRIYTARCSHPVSY